MSKIGKFKYLDNFSGVLDLAEQYFPFEIVKKNFNQRYEKSIKEKCLLHEMKRIEDNLKNFDPSSNYSAAFRWKEHGQNFETGDLYVDFCIWKEVSNESIELKLAFPNYKTKDQCIEMLWLEELAQGINDAQLLFYVEQIYHRNTLNSSINELQDRAIKEFKLTHREESIIHLLKCHLGLEDRWVKKQAVKIAGYKRYTEFLTLNPVGKTYRPPTIDELRRVAFALQDQPALKSVVEQCLNNGKRLPF